MTKKELVEAVSEVLDADENVSDATKEAVLALIRPKVGGGAKSVEDYTVFDDDGQPAYIFCTVHKKWEPVAILNEEGETELLFKEDPKSKNGYRRYCIEGDKAWNAATKALKATKEAVLTDVLEGKITPEEGKAKIQEAEEARKHIPPREDDLGCDERPEPDFPWEECRAGAEEA